MNRPATTRRPCRRRGLIITDLVIGLTLIAVLLSITVITLGLDQRATRAAARHRQLTHAAEAALLALQQSQVPDSPTDPAIRVTLTVLHGDEAPAGYRWVCAESSGFGQRIEVLGVVPAVAADALRPGGAGQADDGNTGDSE
jgi:hypothetical protein